MYSSAYVWAKIVSYLEERLGSLTVSTHLDDAEVVELNEMNLIIHSPSDFRREIIRRRYTGHIEDALKDIFNSNARLIVLDEDQLNAFNSSSPKTMSLASELKISFRASSMMLA